MYIDPRGFMKFNAETVEKMDAIPIIPKKIDGIKFNGFNELNISKRPEDNLVLKKGDNCWICQSW